MTASSESKAMPPAGPQAQRWPGTRPRAKEDAGLGQGAGHPSAIGRACLADRATAIKASLDSRVPARYPCGAADGDGMTRQPPPWRNKRPEKIANPGASQFPGSRKRNTMPAARHHKSINPNSGDHRWMTASSLLTSKNVLAHPTD